MGLFRKEERKDDRMSYLKERSNRIQLFEENMYFCERNPKLMNSIMRTRQHAEFYSDVAKDLKIYPECQLKKPSLQFAEDDDVLVLAKRLAEKKPGVRIGLVNSSNALFPGGTVLQGGDGLEERLCRSTTLYPCLRENRVQEVFYSCDEQAGCYMDTGCFLYLPEVVCFRIRDEAEQNLEEQEWFSVDIISCRFVDASTSKDLTELYQVAIHNGIEILVLGHMDN